MRYLQALRVAFGCIVLASALLAREVVGAPVDSLFVMTVAYVAVTLGAEGARAATKSRGLPILAVTLLIDGIYLGWVIYLTGGPQSPLRFLLYLHIVAVTLLASYRTGLKIAVWHSLLTFVALYAGLAGLLPTSAGHFTRMAPVELRRLSAFNVSAFWLVALTTATFSAMNERELRRRRLDVEALAEMAAEVENITQPRDVADALLRKVTERLSFSRGVVFEPTAEGVVVMASKGAADTNLPPGSDDAVGRALARRKPTLKRELDSLSNPRLAALLPGARNMVLVPLYAEGHALALMAVEHSRPGRRIERRVVSLAAQFATHAALALRKTRLLEEVQRLAETDALTGVANRRVFDATLTREVARANRTGEQLTLVMVDVDHFKFFNDTFGHQAGDDVLRQVARSLTETCREFDTVARYGGEEFAVVLPGCTVDEAVATAERMRAAVSKVPAPIPITASAGTSTYPTDAEDACSLIETSDKALYNSKRNGRDKATAFGRLAHAVLD
jgi:diguanylate cyclase (GGDEF)-like protein